MLLKLTFKHEGYLYTSCLIYILTNYCKCLLFHFLDYGIPVQISIATGVQKRTHWWLKNYHILLKDAVLKRNFKDECHLDANFLICILTNYREFHCFQFFSRSIRTHIPILTVVQNARIRRLKRSHILLKYVVFETVFWRRRSNLCQLFVLCFVVLFSHFPHPNRGSKMAHYRLQNGKHIAKMYFWRLNFQNEGQLYASCLFYIL